MLYIDKLMPKLHLFQALDSDVRIHILEFLSIEKELNMNQIATKLNLSKAAITMHIKKLEDAGLISIKTSAGQHGVQKICCLNENRIIIELGKEEYNNFYEVNIGVGQYSNYKVYPTCGIASKTGLIGELDDPRYLADPERINAGILWFANGYVEYKVPNYLKPNQRVKELQISMEIASEAPGYCENWLSDIYMYFNEIELGFWTSPGDFGSKKGIFTPNWWPEWNQHGLLKVLSINSNGTFIDGMKISEITIEDLNLNYQTAFNLKFAIPEKARNIGGLTIYGKCFGNYDQDIKIRVFYTS